MRFPPLYAATGIRELWLADGRGPEPCLEIQRLGKAGYTAIRPDAHGWMASSCLGVHVRLHRDEEPSDLWFFQLEVRAEL